MRDIQEQERRYIETHMDLATIAGRAAAAKKALMEAYLALHHPGIPYEVTIMDDVLSLDVVFPGLDRSASQQLAQELSDYLQRLLP